MNIRKERVNQLNQVEYNGGPVVFYPVRDLRLHDNFALAFAQKLAIENKAELKVVFVLYQEYINVSERHYEFMFEGLKELEEDLNKKNIPFQILYGTDEEQIDKLIAGGVGAIVTDFSPLRRNQNWKNKYGPKCSVPFYEVDAHNIIPPRVVSEKQEFAAYTIRPKIYKLISDYLEEAPHLVKHIYNKEISKGVDWDEVHKNFKYTAHATRLPFVGGEKDAHKRLKKFLEKKLAGYSENRNDPNKDAQSDLSPYITFGFISRARIALEVCKHENAQIHDLLEKDKNAAKSGTSASAFLEELIVRSELAENFCFYNTDYDNEKSFPDWAQKGIEKHKADKREHIYKLKDFEEAKTHDPLWNAAQNQMLTTGKMHGYMRMYWAKKILEWTPGVHEAMKIAVYLNDVYSLDGRDSNGYTGIAWSIGGVHDRAWFEREVFGQIRYMNYNGCKAKFDVKEYEKTWNKQSQTKVSLFE